MLTGHAVHSSDDVLVEYEPGAHSEHVLAPAEVEAETRVSAGEKEKKTQKKSHLKSVWKKCN